MARDSTGVAPNALPRRMSVRVSADACSRSCRGVRCQRAVRRLQPLCLCPHSPASAAAKVQARLAAPCGGHRTARPWVTSCCASTAPAPKKTLPTSKPTVAAATPIAAPAKRARSASAPSPVPTHRRHCSGPQRQPRHGCHRRPRRLQPHARRHRDHQH